MIEPYDSNGGYYSRKAQQEGVGVYYDEYGQPWPIPRVSGAQDLTPEEMQQSEEMRKFISKTTCRINRIAQQTARRELKLTLISVIDDDP